MLPTLITTLIVVFALVLFIVLRYKKIDKSKYEISTGPSKSYTIAAILYFLLGTLFIIIDFILYFQSKFAAIWFIYGFSVLFYILGLIIFAIIHLNFEAINGDKLIIYRFYKEIPIDIENVKSIKKFVYGYIFLDAENKKLLSVDINSEKTDQFMNLFNERKSKFDNLDDFIFYEVEETTIKQTEKFLTRHIGKSIWKNVLLFLVFTVFIESAFFLFMILEVDRLLAFAIIIFLIIVFCISWKVLLKNKKDTNPKTLIESKEKSDKISIKNQRKSFNIITFFCVIGIGFGILLSGLFTSISLLDAPTKRENLVEVTGTIEYWRTTSGKYGYFAIKIEDNYIEYRHSLNNENDGFDKSFMDEVKRNDVVTILIDPSDKQESTETWGVLYGLKLGDKEYYSYEVYLKNFKDNKSISNIIAYAGGGIIVISIGLIIISHIKYKNEIK